MKRFPQVEVVVARLDVDQQAVHALTAWLSDEERQRAGRFHLARDRRRYTVARGRLRQLLAYRLCTHPRSVGLCYGAHGKPRLAPGSAAAADWRFNVSHSGDLALLAFCRGREVGIDVEAVHAVQDADAIAAWYFPPRELAAFLSLAPRDKALGFFAGWTRTEALGKALGAGLHCASACDDDSGWRLQGFYPAPGYVAALAVERS
jgi:4'-phosphopantetheinyl transferase